MKLMYVVLALCLLISTCLADNFFSSSIDKLRSVFSRPMIRRSAPVKRSGKVQPCSGNVETLCGSFLKTNGTSCFASASGVSCSVNGQTCPDTVIKLCQDFKSAHGIFCTNNGCAQSQ